MAGTVFHPDDLFHRKIGRVAEMRNGWLYKDVADPKYVAIKYDIWRDHERRIPMWPERWTPEKIAWFLESPPEAMAGALAYLHATHGGVRAYLTARGFGPADQAALRSLLVE